MTESHTKDSIKIVNKIVKDSSSRKVRKATTTHADYAMRVWRAVTGMVALPGTKTEAILTTLDALHDRYTEEELTAYLKPFYAAWLERKYSKANPAWLIDWAAVGEIPTRSKSPPEKSLVQSQEDISKLRHELSEFKKRKEQT